jgi:3-methyladenine DNA glycosylase AlkD
LAELKKLLTNPVHECRLTATLILVNQYRRAKPEEKNKLAKFYLAHARYFNNWDLVDSSAGYILGDYLLTRSRLVLKRLAKSKNLWERRIAIIATQAFIAAGEYEDTLTIAKLLMTDEHDLIHKAVGWMLREVGKKSKVIEERFLKQHAEHMPRTMLRYAIEKFPASQRRRYLILKSPL